MTDIVKRLRDWVEHDEDLFEEAADEIERLREALTPFAKLFLWPEDSGSADMIMADEDWDEKYNDEASDEHFIIRGWIKNARKALGEKE